MNMRILSSCILALLLTGCGITAPKYESTHGNNVTVNLEMDIKSGLFSSVEVVAGINDMDKQCQPQYKGVVDLKPGKNEIGLATGQLTYLIVEVAQGSRTSSGSFRRGTLLKPVKGKHYEIDVSYVDNMYDFKLYEVRGKKRKPMKVLPASACKS